MSRPAPIRLRPMRFLAANVLVHVALGFWVLAACGLFVALLTNHRFHVDAPSLASERLRVTYFFGQGGAALCLLVGIVLRNLLHAEPLCPPKLVWLGTLFTGMLFASTAYFFMVALPEIQRYKDQAPNLSHVAELGLSNSEIEGSIEGGLDIYRARAEQKTMIAYRKASSAFGFVVACQALASVGLLGLHLRRSWEESRLGVRRRRGTPPWRVPAA